MLEEEKKMAEEKKARAEEERRWSPDELSMLAKAARKFPAGSQNRWQIIADYINQQLSLPVERTKEDVLKKYQWSARPGRLWLSSWLPADHQRPHPGQPPHDTKQKTLEKTKL